jgi:hypothetical protein
VRRQTAACGVSAVHRSNDHIEGQLVSRARRVAASGDVTSRRRSSRAVACVRFRTTFG